MTEVCQLWGVDKTWTTPYHPQANGMVEQNNRGWETLRAMLLGKSGQMGRVVTTTIKDIPGNPHTATG